jgi:nucleotide-binding universal stress UspA family protein
MRNLSFDVKLTWSGAGHEGAGRIQTDDVALDLSGPAALGEARTILTPDLAVEFRALEYESAVHGLRQLALSEDADVLVLGSTRRGPLGRLLHRSLARGRLRDSPSTRSIRDCPKEGI